MNDGLHLGVTGYSGREEEILQMLNATRATPRPRDYLDWRYLGERTDIAPRVFWLRTGDGKAVAMAALICRPYWFSGQRRGVAVLGDISVHPEWRGKRLSTRLIQAINDDLDASGQHGLVMANAAGERTVAAAGWEVVARLRLHTALVNPIFRLQKSGLPRFLCEAGAAIYRSLLRRVLRLSMQKDISCRAGDGFEGDVQTLWEHFPRQSLSLRDRGRETLEWRYQQPGLACTVLKFFRSEEVVGYAVINAPDAGGASLVQDFLVKDTALAKPCLAALLDHALRLPGTAAVCLALPEGCAYESGLKSLGFLRNVVGGNVRMYCPPQNPRPTGRAWFITAGDKDA